MLGTAGACRSIGRDVVVCDDGVAASLVEDLKSRKACDAVILGCTEIPLAVSAEISPLPVLDSTRLLARAALKTRR